MTKHFYLISPSSPVSMLTLPILTMAAAILAFHALAHQHEPYNPSSLAVGELRLVGDERYLVPQHVF
jgi:hypothetical protein